LREKFPEGVCARVSNFYGPAVPSFSLFLPAREIDFLVATAFIGRIRGSEELPFPLATLMLSVARARECSKRT